MLLTIGQTAKATGLSKTTIAKHIENGKVSAGWNNDTNPPQREIDASEILRVYGVDVNLPPSRRQRVTPTKEPENNPVNDLLKAKDDQIQTLKDQVRTLEHQLDTKDGQIGQLQRLLEAPKPQQPDKYAEIEAKLQETLAKFEAQEAASRAAAVSAPAPEPQRSIFSWFRRKAS